MLMARGTFAEPAVVGDVDQHLRAFRGEVTHEIRKHRFVADECADAMSVHRRDDDLAPSGEVANLRRDVARESQGPRYELAERDQVDFVVAGEGAARRR